MSQSNRPCIIWGATGQCRVVCDILLSEGCEILHLFDNNYNLRSPFPGIPLSYGVKGFNLFVDSLQSLGKRTNEIDFVVAVAGGNSKSREKYGNLFHAAGFMSRRVIHPSAVVSPLASIGHGVQIMAAAHIGAFAHVSEGTIVNSMANIDHDCRLGRYCHVAPCAALAGQVILQDHVFVGTNATILPNLRIGTEVIVGAGAVVTKDVLSQSIVVGSPAKPMVE